MLSMRDRRQPCARCAPICGSISDWRSADARYDVAKEAAIGAGVNLDRLETMVQKFFQHHAQVPLRHVHLVERLDRSQTRPRSGGSRRRAIIRAGVAAVLKVHRSSFRFSARLSEALSGVFCGSRVWREALQDKLRRPHALCSCRSRKPSPRPGPRFRQSIFHSRPGCCAALRALTVHERNS